MPSEPLQFLTILQAFAIRTCVYLSSRWLLSPLTPDIKGFSSIRLQLTGYFLLSEAPSVNPRDEDAVKIPTDQQFTTFKVLSIPFLPCSDARFELQQVGFTASACPNALVCCCLVIGSFGICVNSKQLSLTFVPNGFTFAILKLSFYKMVRTGVFLRWTVLIL